MRQPRWRKARRDALRAQGITATAKRRIWFVGVNALLAVPDYYLNRSIKGFGASSLSVWLQPREACALIAMDRLAGGRSTVLKSYYRYCEMCARPLIADEADERCRIVESSPDARRLPCGPVCARDRDLGTWKRLAPKSYRVRPQIA